MLYMSYLGHFPLLKKTTYFLSLMKLVNTFSSSSSGGGGSGDGSSSTSGGGGGGGGGSRCSTSANTTTIFTKLWSRCRIVA